MNLVDFKNKLSSNGLARNNTWSLLITPPKSLSSQVDSLYRTANANTLNIQRSNSQFDTNRNTIVQDSGYPDFSGSKPLNYPNIQSILVNTNPLLRDLMLYANACSIPSRDMESTEFREYGERRNASFNNVHKDLITSFYCSEDLRERAFFELWQDSIYNPKNKQISYYKDYIADMVVNKYSTGWRNVMATYKFFECYPVSIGGMPLNFDGTQVLRLDVTFKYRYYERTL